MEIKFFGFVPLIEESKNLNYTAAVEKHKLLSKIFENKVGLIHGGLDKDRKKQYFK